MSGPFDGAKIAVLCGSRVLTLLRDDREGLPHRGLWELPGGGREGDESAEACILRELEEETHLRLAADALIWRRAYPAGATGRVLFFAARIGADQAAAARLGPEGQALAWMEVDAFLARADAVPALQSRLRDYLDGRRVSKA